MRALLDLLLPAGCVACGRPGVSGNRLVATADTAMYLAKQHPGGEPVYRACE